MNPDKILVDRILEGDTETYTELINRYYHKINAFARKMGMGKEDAEDVCQEVFIKVYNHLYQYNARWSFSTWLYRIALNTCKNHYKKKRVGTCELDDPHFYGKQPSTESFMEDVIRQQMVQDMLGILDADTRAMMILYYYNDLPLKEIGKLYGVSPEAVKMKISRARTRIGKAYRNEAKDGELNEI